MIPGSWCSNFTFNNFIQFCNFFVSTGKIDVVVVVVVVVDDAFSVQKKGQSPPKKHCHRPWKRLDFAKKYSLSMKTRFGL